jgi:hypothetical protein
MPERSQRTRSTSSEQWRVVSRDPDLALEVRHNWRLVRLENSEGLQRPGLQCTQCTEVKVLSNKDFLSYGGQLHNGKY